MWPPDVTIEMCVSRDQSLSVIVSGKSDAVLRARKDFTQQLQQQVFAVILF